MQQNMAFKVLIWDCLSFRFITITPE